MLYTPRWTMVVRTVVLAAIVLVALSPVLVAGTKKGYTSKTKTSWGVHTTSFNTPEGEVRVYLPDDMAAGDSLSGSVVAVPSGQTEAERMENTDELSGYVVELAGDKTPVSSGLLKWTVPVASVAGGAAVLILRDSGGKEVMRSSVPVLSTPPGTDFPAVPTPQDYELPHIGQAGKPVAIKGPFDGSLDTTRVRIGGRDVDVLAESPRKAVAMSPRDIVGPTTIEVREGDVSAAGEMNNLKIRLSAPKTKLLEGETTELNVRISGLEGIEEPVHIALINESPEIVSMEGGETHGFVIAPGDAAETGTYATSLTLTGVEPGGFNIFAAAGDQDCVHWVPEERTEWGEWHKRRDGTQWRDGKIISFMRCADPGKGHITKDETEIGKAHEEKTAFRTTTTEDRELDDGGRKVTRTVRDNRGRSRGSSTAEYDKDGKLKNASETRSDGRKTEWEYDENGDPDGVRKMDKKGTLKEEWKKEGDSWYKKKGDEWVERGSGPSGSLGPRDVPGMLGE